MATVNYSIPDEVKELFNTAFARVNRSAVIADLMRRAAEHELLLQRRREAIVALLTERTATEPIAKELVDKALEELRR